MKQRCENTNHDAYANYGGRGITVCGRWKHSFETFLADMGERPSMRHTLERRDNDLGYSKDNCLWDTRLAQASNRRNSPSITYRGETKTVAEWARTLNIRYIKLYHRLFVRHWPIERALSTTG
jgi:hypothetical protein